MKLRFNKFIGTGGIGTGVLFQLDSNENIGRNESRLAVLTDARDYCKQHIILHYISKLLSPDIHIWAIGQVGKDSHGKKLLEEMSEVGIDTQFVGVSPNNPTIFSTCVQYSDKSVFNVTSSNNASGAVTPKYIEDCIDSLNDGIDNRTLILAVPEVPVNTRIALLRKGRLGNAFCVASILREEVEEFEKAGGFELCNLLSINEDEAQAIAGIKQAGIFECVQACYHNIKKRNPHIMLIVTAGENGSYSVYNNKTEYIKAKTVIPISTAGAGDAYIAGVICGLAMGMPLQFPEEGKNENVIRATDFGALLAGLSVESKHTIADNINKNKIFEKLDIMKENTYGI